MSLNLSCSQCFVILGLVCDIAGALCVAFEVFKRYKGNPIEQSQSLKDVDYPKPQHTEEYRVWEKSKLSAMSIGLGLLIVGFILQIIGTSIVS